MDKNLFARHQHRSVAPSHGRINEATGRILVAARHLKNAGNEASTGRAA